MKKELKKNGFTMIEALLAMMATMIVSTIFLVMFQVQSRLVSLELIKQDQIAILQLRQVVALADTYGIEGDTLEIQYNHQIYTIGFDRNRLVKREGYEIFMEGIEYASFYTKDEELYLSYTKRNKDYTYQIA